MTNDTNWTGYTAQKYMEAANCIVSSRTIQDRLDCAASSLAILSENHFEGAPTVFKERHKEISDLIARRDELSEHELGGLSKQILDFYVAIAKHTEWIGDLDES